MEVTIVNKAVRISDLVRLEQFRSRNSKYRRNKMKKIKEIKEVEALYGLVAYKKNKQNVIITEMHSFGSRSLSVYNKRIGDIPLGHQYDGLMTYEEAKEILKAERPIANDEKWIEKTKIIKFDLPIKGTLRVRYLNKI